MYIHTRFFHDSSDRRIFLAKVTTECIRKYLSSHVDNPRNTFLESFNFGKGDGRCEIAVSATLSRPNLSGKLSRYPA